MMMNKQNSLGLIIVAQKADKELGNLRVWFFKMIKIINKEVDLHAVKHTFINWIESLTSDAKLANIWPIENIWNVLKEKLRGLE